MPRVVIDPAVPDGKALATEIARLRGLDVEVLRARWHTAFRRRAPPHLPHHLLFRILAYRLQNLPRHSASVARLFAPSVASNKLILQRLIKRRNFRPSVSGEGESEGAHQ